MSGPAARNAEQEIEQTLAAWAAAVAGADAEAIGLLVTEDAELWSHGVAPLRGRQAVVDAMRSFFARFKMRQEFERPSRAVTARPKRKLQLALTASASG